MDTTENFIRSVGHLAGKIVTFYTTAHCFAFVQVSSVNQDSVMGLMSILSGAHPEASKPHEVRIRVSDISAYTIIDKAKL